MGKVIAISILIVLVIGIVLVQTGLPTRLGKILQNRRSSEVASIPSSPTPTPISTPKPARNASHSDTGGPTAVPTPPANSPPISNLGTNQLINPCFDGPHNGDPLNWTEAPPGGWDVSANKNPCGDNKTAARLNDPSLAGQSQPNVHEYIYQVVTGQGATLTVQMACIQHFALIGDTNIYGGSSANGPWTLVWTPFTIADCAESTVDDRGWKPVHEAQTTLSQAYPYYKFEFHAMRDADGGGIKFTSAYFSSQ